jgi:acetoacetyl-CoA synthetase
VLRRGLQLDKELRNKIKQEIAAGATKRHVPKIIQQVTAIPHTISGKKVELAVQQVIHGEEVKNKDALANPEALEEFKTPL